MKFAGQLIRLGFCSAKYDCLFDRFCFENAVKRFELFLGFDDTQGLINISVALLVLGCFYLYGVF